MHVYCTSPPSQTFPYIETKCLYIIDNTLGVDRDNCFSAKFSTAHKDFTAIKSHRKNKKEARRAELDRNAKVSRRESRRNKQRGGQRRAKVSIEYSEYQITGCNLNYKVFLMHLVTKSDNVIFI